MKQKSSKDRLNGREQRKEGAKLSAPAGESVYQAINKEASHELKRDNAGLAWSGMAAGLSMGFSMIVQGMLVVQLGEGRLSSLFSPLGYSIGFLIVILGRQQLFTENTLTPILPLLKDKRLSSLVNVGRLWGIVLLSNLFGSFLFATVIAVTNVVEPEVKIACIELAKSSVSHGFGNTVLRGIFAGWLIALMVWLLPFAQSARIWVIIIISYIVGLGSFSHVIAGSVSAFYLSLMGEISFIGSFTDFIFPALIGNTIGGVALVAVLAHEQFGPGRDIKSTDRN